MACALTLVLDNCDSLSFDDKVICNSKKLYFTCHHKQRCLHLFFFREMCGNVRSSDFREIAISAVLANVCQMANTMFEDSTPSQLGLPPAHVCVSVCLSTR